MRLLRIAGRALPTLLLLAAVAAAWFGWHTYASHHLDPHAEADNDAASAIEPTQVELGPAKLTAAGIQTAPVELRVQQLSVVIPGRMAYDPSQVVQLRLGTAGVLTKVLVQPGDRVTAGQVLATMNSPELGSARADQLQFTAQLELARRQADWDRVRAAGIHKLVDAINRGQTPEEIRKNFTDQLIGAAREKLLSAYTDQLLAESMVARMTSAVGSGALAGRTVDERRSQLESRGAALKSVIEQTVYDADQASQASQLALVDAQRRADIAAGRVTALVGHALARANDSRDASSDPASGPSRDLSSIEILAPRSGTVEQKLFNEQERVEAGNVLMILADTSRLWLKADIRESQWNALALSAGQPISATSPALPGEKLVGTVVMMGREVDPQTNAVSLVASVENPYGRLKPGLYVRAELPMGETASDIVIPEAAIATHAGDTFVFVTNDEKKFTRRDVRIGRSQAGVTEILAGLEVGERIAVAGVFVLKSELLLEKEE